MRVLFLESHPMWIHGLPNGFKDAGHEVLVSGPITKENLPILFSEFNPELVISMGWGPENTLLDKQLWIRECVKSAKVPHVYWATEDPTHTYSFTIPFLKTVEPDFVFTICSKTVEFYKNLGISAAHMDFGFHSRVHYRTEPIENYKGCIAVVANAYPNKLKMYPDHFRKESLRILLKPILEANIRVDFYGTNWDKMEPYLGVQIPPEWIHGYIPYTEANKVYSSNDIIIGIQNHQTQLTQRIYEILGSGGFLITNNTPEVNRLFKPDKDLIISSTPEETLQLVKYYLDRPKEREIIRTQGIIAVDKHSYRIRAEYMLKVLTEENVFTTKPKQYKLNLIANKSYIHNQYEFYTACNGDTLWGISKTFGTTVEEIMKLNDLDSDRIEAGQLIKIKDLKSVSINPSSILISKGSSANQWVALTYDAGDGAEGTPLLLDALNRNNVKATFFLTGKWIEKYPSLAKQIGDNGHEIGNHTYSHPDLTKISSSEIIEELKRTESQINEILENEYLPIFRPPFGAWNKEALRSVGEAGYKYSIYWSLDTIDWQHPSVDTIVNKITEKVSKNDIILMHLEYVNTAKATEIIIPVLKNLGYEFVTVSQMLKCYE